jgi:hypothetical protein
MLLAGASATPALADSRIGNVASRTRPPVSALSGWNFVGSREFHSSSSVYGDHATSWARSTGGDFEGCMPKASGDATYVLMEYDPSNADDYVGQVTVNSIACAVFRDIGRFVDGTDGTAEFYLVTWDDLPDYASYYD